MSSLQSRLSVFVSSAIALCMTALVLAIPTPAQAMKIQDIKTKAGIRVWLVEEHAVPLVALRFSFMGGSAQEADGKEGVANFLSGMLDEGAGDMDAAKYQARMEELAMRMSFDATRDYQYGSLETLAANRKEAVAMLKLALEKPLFATDAVDRVRSQLLSNLAYSAKNPDSVVAERWAATAFKGHPYGRPSSGTVDSLKTITRDDLAAYKSSIFARDTLQVVVVGDITADQAIAMVDDVFGGLPATGKLKAIPAIEPNPVDKLTVVEMNVPQSVARFGLRAMPRKDKDFIPAFVLNHILGGGGFASRLMEEVREKRGLAYSVYSFLQPMSKASIFVGGVATKNEEMAQSLEIIKGELQRLANDGPTATELENAKSNLIGSFALRFDTNAKIANQLLQFMTEGLGIDYVDRRNGEVAAVTLDDMKRVAKRLLVTNDLFVTVVGKPKGLIKAGG